MSVTAPDGSVWPAGSLRALEHESIRSFVAQAAADGYLKGRVLDYGCGTAPYKPLVEAAGGEWFGYDRAYLPDNHVGDVGDEPDRAIRWDAILCTQVIQYSHTPWGMVYALASLMRDSANRYLVLTYPTNWPEAQAEDLYRFTKAGMERLLTEAGFTIIRHERRAEIQWKADAFSLGGGVVAKA